MEANYVVTGMTCGHCVAHVKEEVGELAGVTGVEVELEGGRMTITSDEPVPFEQVTEAVQEAGDYTVAQA
ncbi:heavy-metal-associated domain-containing protein [uncultured Tessaracoccus sp.]|uniref:heavy-metal-associated domain-containing protein n=1 Tax=uncultured Tessaracoccus sp. TaxID=905023 RepID=UPI0025D94302|nr:heavy metal-associated domain-containing protein [uncultured Tessaracoccus sp.]